MPKRDVVPDEGGYESLGRDARQRLASRGILDQGGSPGALRGPCRRENFRKAPAWPGSTSALISMSDSSACPPSERSVGMVVLDTGTIAGHEPIGEHASARLLDRRLIGRSPGLVKATAAPPDGPRLWDDRPLVPECV